MREPSVSVATDVGNRGHPGFAGWRASAYSVALAVLLLGLPTISFAGPATQKTIIAASSNNFPPVNLLDSDKNLTGFGRELAVAVVKAAGGEVSHIHSRIWTNVLDWLAEGTADFIHDTGYTPDRTGFLDFSEPILSMPEEIFVLKDRYDIQSIDSLSDRSVACVNKHITHLYLMKIPEINCLVVKTPLDGLQALLSGEVDAFIYPRQIVLYLAHKIDAADRIKVVGAPLRTLTWHMVVKKGNTDMLVFLNRGITRVKATGEYDRIYDKWFGNIVFKGFSLAEVLYIIYVGGGLLLAIALGFTLWTWTLHRKVNQRTAQLQKSEQRFKDFAEVATDWFWETDEKHHFSYFSDRLSEFVGIEPARLIGTNRLEIGPDETDDENWKNHVADSKAHRPFRNFRQRVDAVDGGFRNLRINGKAVFDAAGIFRGYIGASADITDEVAAEEQLRQAQKMQAVGQLTGGVAHDFNNLLLVIAGNIELLKTTDDSGPKMEMYLDKVLGAVERGASLTQKLLAFSRQQALSPKATDVNGLIGGMEDMLRRTLGEAIELKTILAADLRIAMIDSNQLEHALLNLALNARDAMRDGGALMFETANVFLDEDYADQHEEVKAGDYVQVAVTDTGEGMMPEVLEHVFEPFFTTKEVGKGSGLGLSMVFGFVKQSGGHISIYSEVGHGTTVKVYLPRAGRESEIATDVKQETRELERGSERVLVVEDDPMVREFPVEVLRGMGYEVVEALDGKEALAQLREGRTFDLLFTDVVLPGGMSGKQIADEAKRLQPGIRVLFTTGYAENAVVHDGQLDEGVTLINKPYMRHELLEIIRAVLDAEEA